MILKYGLSEIEFSPPVSPRTMNDPPVCFEVIVKFADGQLVKLNPKRETNSN